MPIFILDSPDSTASIPLFLFLIFRLVKALVVQAHLLFHIYSNKWSKNPFLNWEKKLICFLQCVPYFKRGNIDWASRAFRGFDCIAVKHKWNIQSRDSVQASSNPISKQENEKKPQQTNGNVFPSRERGSNFFPTFSYQLTWPQNNTRTNDSFFPHCKKSGREKKKTRL